MLSKKKKIIVLVIPASLFLLMSLVPSLGSFFEKTFAVNLWLQLFVLFALLIPVILLSLLIAFVVYVRDAMQGSWRDWENRKRKITSCVIIILIAAAFYFFWHWSQGWHPF